MKNQYHYAHQGMSFLTLLFTSFCLTARMMAQEVVTFVEEGKTWYCLTHSHANDDPQPPISPEDPLGMGIDCIFTMAGDTLISDNTYKKVYCQHEEEYGDKEPHYYCAVREEDGRVLCVGTDMEEEKLLYDFSSPNETLYLCYGDHKFGRSPRWPMNYWPSVQMVFLVCELTGSNNDQLAYSHDVGTWVEGVGSVSGNPFDFELVSDRPSASAQWIELVSCMADGKIFFNREWLSEPIGPVDIHSPLGLNKFAASMIYDLQGRCLQGQPRRGLYIQDGQKKVVSGR